jgi:hypothetical protein
MYFDIIGKGADKSQRDRRKATASELARKAALRNKADNEKAAKACELCCTQDRS